MPRLFSLRPPLGRAALLLALMVAAALAFASGAAAQSATRSMTLNQLRGYGWPTVTINFNLRSLNNTPLGEVRPEQFIVEENGVAQKVTGVALGHDIGVPLSVVLGLDTSGSMAGPKLIAAQAAAAAFIGALGPQDEVALVPFGTTVMSPTGFTTDRARITAALNAQQAQGNTALYDAVYESARLVNTSHVGNRRAIVLLTDGQDTGSKKSLEMAVAAAQDAGSLLYTIGVGGDTDDAVMTRLATPTGGRYAKAPEPQDLQAIYVELARELAGQFLLTYESTTRVNKPYQTILVRIRYIAPNGETLTQETRYRPPAAALLPAPPPPPIPTPLPARQGPLPSGLPDGGGSASGPAPGSGASGGSAPPGFLSAFAGLLAGLSVLLLAGAGWALASPTPVRERLERYVAVQELAGVPGAARPGFIARVLLPMFDSIGQRLDSLTPSSYLDLVQRLLYQMGPPYRLGRVAFIGIQVGAGVLAMLLLLAWALVASPGSPLSWLFAGLVGLAIGLYVPYFLLVRRVTARKRKLLHSLPAALDFMAIMVEAGTGFDAALTELVRRWRNTLTDEFALLLIDFQIGKPRRDAWRDLMLRTALPDLNSFVVAMMQSEQTGASIGGLLRTQADQMRIRRRQRAEEEARVAPVKMIIPMALFIFPCLLIVVLGPALPQLFNTFSHLGK
jgi:tight adherence protein C